MAGFTYRQSINYIIHATMVALSRFFYTIAGTCALYVALAPFFSSWHGSPSLFTLAYWICACLLFIAATLTPSKNSATLAFVGSVYLTARLSYTLTRHVMRKLGLLHTSKHAANFPPTGFERVHHILKMPAAITLLIFSLASLVISALIIWRLPGHNVVADTEHDEVRVG